MKMMFALTLVLTTSLVADTPKDRWSFKSPAATAAVTRYERRIEELSVQQEKDLADFKAKQIKEANDLRLTLVTDLMQAKEKAMQASDLDEAVKVRDAIEEIKKESGNAAPPPSATASPRVPKEKPKQFPDGTFKMKDQNGKGEIRWMTFRGNKVVDAWVERNGQRLANPAVGPLKLLPSGGFILDYGPIHETWWTTASPDKLFMEYFDDRVDFHANVMAERVR